MDSMPINSIGGMWFVDLWDPKYAAHISRSLRPLICWAKLYECVLWLLALPPMY